MFKIIFFWCFFISACSAYKLLVVFPIPGNSHAILGEGYVRHLLDAGHEVTYVTPIPLKNPSPKLRQIDISANFEVMNSDLLDLEKLMKKEIDLTDTTYITSMMTSVANATLTNPNVARLVENPAESFDAVILEWLYTEVYSGFASVFKCPLIWSSSMDPHAMVLWLIDEGPNPAYVADHLSPENPPFNFYQRVKELWAVFKWMRIKWPAFASFEERIYNSAFGPLARKRGVTLAPYEEAKYNGSLMLGNSHVAIGQPMRLPQNYKPILGYHIQQEVKPLPENIQSIMENAKHGVIYFSMGSMLKSNTLPDVLKKDLLKMFSGLKQTVLWKFEENLPNLPKNVHIVNWAPQQSVLAHRNCVLFITHGGLLSLTETIHYGVPIIGIPMFADQFLNINRAQNKGFALKVDLDWDVTKNLKAAIEEILGNPKYRETVKEISFIYHHRPVPPGAELVHWVEHVVATRGAPHLRSPALKIPFYQKMYLDLAVVILSVVLVLVYIVKALFCSRKRSDLNKKNR